VTEYVTIPAASPGVSELKMALSNGADLAADGNRAFTVFPGTGAAFTFDADEAGWGVVFSRGIGDAGIERLVIGNTTYPLVTILTDATRVSGGANPNTVDVLIPRRTSAPLDVNVSLSVNCPSSCAVGSARTYTQWVHGVTGILALNVSIIPTGSATNDYSLSFSFNLTDGQAMTYNMIETLSGTLDPGRHFHFTGTAVNPTTFEETPQFSVFWEPHEYVVSSPPPSGSSSDHSFHLADTLVGFAELVVGGTLVAAGLAGVYVTAPTGLGLVVFGGTAVLGANIVFDGSIQIAHGVGILSDDAYRAAQDQLARFGSNSVVALAAGACLGSLVAGVPKLATALVCTVAAGTVAYALGVDVTRVVKAAVEALAQGLAIILDLFTKYVIPFVSVAVGFGLVLGALKLLLLVLLSPFRGFNRGKLGKFYLHVYNWNIPVWSSFVENRLLGMKVRT
jgi:hypothetical protein